MNLDGNGKTPSAVLGSESPQKKNQKSVDKKVLSEEEINRRIEIGRKYLNFELGEEETKFLISTSREKLKLLLWNS